MDTTLNLFLAVGLIIISTTIKLIVDQVYIWQLELEIKDLEDNNERICIDNENLAKQLTGKTTQYNYSATFRWHPFEEKKPKRGRPRKIK